MSLAKDICRSVGHEWMGTKCSRCLESVVYQVFLDGILQQENVDYYVASNTISFHIPPRIDSTIQVFKITGEITFYQTQGVSSICL